MLSFWGIVVICSARAPFLEIRKHFIMATCTFANVQSHCCKLLLFLSSLQQTAFFLFSYLAFNVDKTVYIFPQNLVRASSLSFSCLWTGGGDSQMQNASTESPTQGRAGGVSIAEQTLGWGRTCAPGPSGAAAAAVEHLDNP